MKKHVSILLRIVFAAVGIAYIAWSVDWIDRVEVRPGTRLPTGLMVEVTSLLPVIEGDVNPRRQDEPLVLDGNPALAVTARTGRPVPVTVTAADLNDPQRYLLRPSFITTLAHADVSLLLLGLVLVAPAFPVQAYRWWILMKSRGLPVTYGKALKLTMVGCFFNYCMPGSTGGDVVKAYYAAQRTDRRTDSVMSVIVDRVTGLLGLVALAGVVGLMMVHEPLARTITINIWLLVLVMGVCAAVYFSDRIRQRTGLNWVLRKLPAQSLLTRIDDAARAYRTNKRAVLVAVLVSIPVHLALASATAIAGYAMGMETSLGLLLTVVPVIFLSGAFPITPQGAGVWEALGYLMLLPTGTATMNQIVAMLMMIRLYQLAFSLTGSFFLLRGDVHLHPERDEPADAAPLRPSAGQNLTQ